MEDVSDVGGRENAILKVPGKTLAHSATRIGLSLVVGLAITISQSVQAASDGSERPHPCETWEPSGVPAAPTDVVVDAGAATELLRLADRAIERGDYSGAAKAYMESNMDAPSTHADLGASLALVNMRFDDLTLDKVLVLRAQYYRGAMATYCRVRGDPAQESALRRFSFAAMLERQVWDIDAYLRMRGATSDGAPALRQVMIVGRAHLRMAPRLDAAIVHQLRRPTPARVKPLSRNAEWVAVYDGDGFAGFVHATLISATK